MFIATTYCVQGVLAKSKGVVFAHQMWGEVCVYNFRADLGFPPPICYPRPDAALDTVLSWEVRHAYGLHD
jgi:hypothetical protein